MTTKYANFVRKLLFFSIVQLFQFRFIILQMFHFWLLALLSLVNYILIVQHNYEFENMQYYGKLMHILWQLARGE